jgi:ketosteroid isomerase-like protein
VSTTDPTDRLDLRDLAQRYAEAVDRRDVDAFVELFTPDASMGVFEHGEDASVAEYRGRAELATVLELVTFYAATFHIVANHRCDVSGSDATGTTYCLARHLIESDSGAKDIEMLIRYDDTYRKTGGDWQFTRRDIRRQWTVEQRAERAKMPISAEGL